VPAGDFGDHRQPQMPWGRFALWGLGIYLVAMILFLVIVAHHH
jgi:hypothetical protein